MSVEQTRFFVTERVDRVLGVEVGEQPQVKRRDLLELRLADEVPGVPVSPSDPRPLRPDNCAEFHVEQRDRIPLRALVNPRPLSQCPNAGPNPDRCYDRKGSFGRYARGVPRGCGDSRRLPFPSATRSVPRRGVGAVRVSGGRVLRPVDTTEGVEFRGREVWFPGTWVPVIVYLNLRSTFLPHRVSPPPSAVEWKKRPYPPPNRAPKTWTPRPNETSRAYRSYLLLTWYQSTPQLGDTSVDVYMTLPHVPLADHPAGVGEGPVVLRVLGGSTGDGQDPEPSPLPKDDQKGRGGGGGFCLGEEHESLSRSGWSPTRPPLGFRTEPSEFHAGLQSRG